MERILLIDDSLIQHRILKVMLEEHYRILTAASGFDGIKMARDFQPDLILLDYNMPMMTGKETFRKLQEQKETREIPVIFLTGVDERWEVEEVLKMRPQRYLLKPIEQEALLSAIKSVLLKSHSGSHAQAKD